jgi:hypothetical protein
MDYRSVVGDRSHIDDERIASDIHPFGPEFALREVRPFDEDVKMRMPPI